MKWKTLFLITNRISMLFVGKLNLHIQHCNYSKYVHGTEGKSIQHFGEKASQKETTRKTLMWGGNKVKISLLQAVEAPRVVRGQGSHIT
jgi:hypothetical protein